MGHSDEVALAKSNLAKIEQNLEDVTNNVLMPVIGKISGILEKIMDLNFKQILKDIVDAITGGIKGAFDGIKTLAAHYIIPLVMLLVILITSRLVGLIL